MSQEFDGDFIFDSDPMEDLNYVAYKAIEAELKSSSMGKWVAFVDGELVLTEDNEDILFDKLEELHPSKSAFVHKIVEVEPVINIPTNWSLRR